jgi:SAM-dependent methyltransferase
LSSARSGLSRKLARGLIPAAWRRRIRRFLRETPIRLRDLGPDLLSSRDGGAVPPARLRIRVSLTSARNEFLLVGRDACAAIRRVFEASRSANQSYPRWLDYGCGSGRLARHLAALPEVEELWGVDVDGDAVAWCSAHLPGLYLAIPEDPPTGLPAAHFDVVCAVSVFAHLDEERQLAWLAELHRALRPGGLLIASTHPPELTYMRPDLSREQLTLLSRRGFLFAPGHGEFNDDGTFHTREYLMKTWARLFGLVRYEEYGLSGYQDLSVWNKW